MFSIAAPLSNILQGSGIGISLSISSIAEYVESLQKLRFSYEEQYHFLKKEIDDLSLPTNTDKNNRMKTEICPTVFAHITDNVLTQITERFIEIHKGSCKYYVILKFGILNSPLPLSYCVILNPTPHPR